jgi:hypothetical protein
LQGETIQNRTQTSADRNKSTFNITQAFDSVIRPLTNTNDPHTGFDPLIEQISNKNDQQHFLLDRRNINNTDMMEPDNDYKQEEQQPQSKVKITKSLTG